VSNGVALTTIATQYLNLQQPAPEVSRESDQFTVRLPLIAPSHDILSAAQLAE